MRQPIILLLLSLIALSSISQDLIITHQNDTINCKIEGVDNDIIIYSTYKSKNYSSRWIRKAEVKDTIVDLYVQQIRDKNILEAMNPNFIITKDRDTIYCKVIQNHPVYVVYSESINGKDIIKGIYKTEVLSVSQSEAKQKNSLGSFEINPMAGYSGRFGDFPGYYTSEEKQLMNEIKSGYFISLRASYNISEMWGSGIVYSYFGSHGEGTIPIPIEDNEIINARTYIDIDISFIAPIGNIAIKSKNEKFKVFLGVSPGIILYKETVNIEGLTIITKGSCFGLGIHSYFSYFFNDNVGISLNANFITGKLKSSTSTFGSQTMTTEYDDGNKFNVGRAELGAGLIFKF